MNDDSQEKPASLIATPEGYADWLMDIKGRIHTAQQRATLAVNRELVFLYWQIGQDILARQAAQGWGAKVIERLAHDLREAFPEMKGFSRSNLMYMRAFAEAWPEGAIVQQTVGQLEGEVIVQEFLAQLPLPRNLANIHQRGSRGMNIPSLISPKLRQPNPHHE